MVKNNYNKLSKILHHLALNKEIGELSFDIESSIFANKNLEGNLNPIFISGLARSGTTILMQTIFDTGRFKSLQYSDMPFILMPNIWKKLYNNVERNNILKERIHQDGIYINSQSPEAFDEIFWKVFTENDYIKSEKLIPYTIEEKTINKFKKFISLVLLSVKNINQHRYLSKNNNNILRIKSIQKAFPHGKILITYRDPIQHAYSLLNQHLHLINEQTKDPFILTYMNLIGHYEFGKGHKPFIFNNECESKIQIFSKIDINYWLLMWRNYYNYLLENFPSNGLLIKYEDLCNNPKKVLANISKNINQEINDKTIWKSPEYKKINNLENNISEECGIILNKLDSIYFKN